MLKTTIIQLSKVDANVLLALKARNEAQAASATVTGAVGVIEGLVTQAETARNLSQAWAEGTEPGGEGTKSSKEYAEDAAVQVGIAEGHKTDAETAKTDAETARDKAEQWAEEDEDVEVEAGKFSAKHWAAKSELFASEVFVDEMLAYIAAVEADGGWVQNRLFYDDTVRSFLSTDVYNAIAFFTDANNGGAKI
jgi:hypothetical protein